MLRAAVLSLLISLLVAPPSLAANSTAAAWEAIASVRGDLAAAGHLQADFTQTYTPAGFTQGEKESGKLALALPDCLRWDYTTPFPKSFLLCGKDTYAWNPGETTGHHGRLESQDATGLDLLLLPLEQLRQRYDATLAEAAGDGPTISLLPRGAPATAKAAKRPLASAQLVVDAAHKHLVALTYKDAEGNLTRFDISGYRHGVEAGRFEPPVGIAWQEASE